MSMEIEDPWKNRSEIYEKRLGVYRRKPTANKYLSQRILDFECYHQFAHFYYKRVTDTWF